MELTHLDEKGAARMVDVDKQMEIGDIVLLKKSGGKSGNFIRK